MRKFILLLFIAFTFSEVQAAPDKFSDEAQLSSLLDSFSVAIVKKDKAWMSANIADTCMMYNPSGTPLDKAAIIKVFTEGIYNISKSSVNKKAFKVDGAGAGGSADFIVEGIGKINGDSVDISGTYQFSLKFKKADKGWQISEIVIAGN